MAYLDIHRRHRAIGGGSSKCPRFRATLVFVLMITQFQGARRVVICGVLQSVGSAMLHVRYIQRHGTAILRRSESIDADSRNLGTTLQGHGIFEDQYPVLAVWKLYMYTPLFNSLCPASFGFGFVLSLLDICL